jgi:hypothetical protein
VRDTLAGDGVLQCSHNVVLAHNVVERLWPPFARDDLVGRRQAVRRELKVERRKLKDRQRERQSGTPGSFIT